MGAERRPVNVERKGERDECSWRLQRGLMNYLLRYSSGRFRCFKVDKRIKPFFLFSFFPSRRKYRTPTPCRGLRNANVLDIRISVLRRRFRIFFFFINITRFPDLIWIPLCSVSLHNRFMAKRILRPRIMPTFPSMTTFQLKISFISRNIRNFHFFSKKKRGKVRIFWMPAIRP